MRIFHFAYMSHPTGESLRPHQLRDGDAFAELLAALTSLGHEYGGLIINHPTIPSSGADDSLRHVQHLDEHDLLVLTTRPPLNDSPSKDPKHVKSSHTKLEGKLFAAIRDYVVLSTRDQIQLHPDEAVCLKKRFENRADTEFFVKGHARLGRFEASYKGSGAGDKTYAGYEPNITTAGYLVYTSPVQLPGRKTGPRLLASFGMSGTISLVFAHFLRNATVQSRSTRKGTSKPGAFAWDLLSTVLKQPGIAMVEITINNRIPSMFYNLDFADHWKYELVAPSTLYSPL
jgi:hypothetical protein